MTENVSIIIENKKGKILVLKRSSYEKWYPGKWCILAEKIKEGETPDECFKRGLREEIGVENWENAEKKNCFFFQDGDFKRKIYPCRCVIENEDIKLNHEHSEYKWVTLEELLKLDIAKPVKKHLQLFYQL